ncbi:helix-turn-helix transcriptional regulator [Collimonas humicola]|uniref:helix-turn-helix transcriptional regulator n=1 Tax=Collimonas humicola TaxID=2825886 RepID=UPI001B8BCF5E|nr:AlpA family phage regulatory protein [Collimonas humicola]
MSQYQNTSSKPSIERLPVVMARTGKSRASIYVAMKEGKFPASVSVGARAIGWLSSDIDAWIENRVKVSRAA